jgi:ATP-dependent exoDNAse (exonuclease V) beta subunit
VIDALWCAEERWHLVEFKTDRIRDEAELAAHLCESDYVAQVARYVAAATPLLGQRPEPALCFLNVAGRVHLVTDRWEEGTR